MAHFSVAETAEILDLPTTVVDQLVRSGQLPAHGDRVAADAIQSYLSQSFVRLFRAQAAMAATPSGPAESLIARSVADYEEELRIAPRYVPKRPLGGTFRDFPFTLLQLSTTGLRIRHDRTVRAGDVARITVALQQPERTFMMHARVIWTTIGQRGDDTFCISGLRVLETEPIAQLIHDLRETGELQVDGGRRRRISPLGGLTDEEVASVIRAVRTFTSNPEEAGRWYSRARFALADEKIRAAAPPRVRDREEVVGVWEYLDRRLDIAKVASVVTWLRQTRASAAEAQMSL